MMIPSRISRSVTIAGTLAETWLRSGRSTSVTSSGRGIRARRHKSAGAEFDFPSFSRCSMLSCKVSQLFVRRAPDAPVRFHLADRNPF